MSAVWRSDGAAAARSASQLACMYTNTEKLARAAGDT